MQRDVTGVVRWLRLRSLLAVAAVQATMAAVIVASASLQVHVPIGGPAGSAAVGVWALVPVPAASAVAVALASDQSDFENAAARRLRPYELAFVSVATGGFAAALAAAFHAGGRPDLIPATLRNVALLTGIALLSGRFLRRGLSWVLPLAVVLPLLYFGFDARAEPSWWAVPLRSFDASTAATAGVVLVLGTSAVCWSPWHTRMVFRRPRRCRHWTAARRCC